MTTLTVTNDDGTLVWSESDYPDASSEQIAGGYLFGPEHLVRRVLNVLDTGTFVRLHQSQYEIIASQDGPTLSDVLAAMICVAGDRAEISDQVWEHLVDYLPGDD